MKIPLILILFPEERGKGGGVKIILKGIVNDELIFP